MSYYVSPEQYELAAKNGICKRTVYRRVYERGWLVEKAITEPIREFANDPEYKHWSDVAVSNGIERKLFWQRVKVNKWDYEKAATHPVMTKAETGEAGKKKIKYNFTTPEIIEKAAKNGIDYDCLWYRVRRLNWSIEEAVNTPILSREETLKRAWKNSPMKKGLPVMAYTDRKYFNQ